MTLVSDSKGLTFNSSHGNLKINTEGDFTPGDLLVTSVAGCSGLVFKKILANRGISYDELRVDTTHKRADEKPRRFTQITIHMTLKGHGLDEKLIQRLFTHVYPNCTIAQSVKGAIDVEEELEIVED
ncbi:OsmC family protein [Sporolactobacillus sp. Y61]|uniref:OsmC family protein n=1 Tax=Sporolactobacillus sp. Y61 TaxID=3160863 RepID=A0AAU8IJ81_9BACL